jgi:hypothetical protein
MMLVISFSGFARPIKNGPDATVVQNDPQEYQYDIKGEHEKIMASVVYPLPNKWKHDIIPFLTKSFPSLVRIQFPFLRKDRQIPVREHDHNGASPDRQEGCGPFHPVWMIAIKPIKRHDRYG